MPHTHARRTRLRTGPVLALAVLGLLAAPRPAAAGAGGAPGLSTSPAVAAASDSPDYRAPGSALALSLLGPVVGVAGGLTLADTPGAGSAIGAGLLLGGLVLGPSLGHAWVGDWRRVGWMSGARLALLGASYASAALIVTSDAPAPNLLTGVLLLGFVGVTVWDVAHAPVAARQHNARLGAMPVAVAPWLGADGRTGGLALAGRLP